MRDASTQGADATVDGGGQNAEPPSTEPVVRPLWARARQRWAESGDDPAPELAPEPWDRRLDRRASSLVFIVCLVVYLATATYTVAQINDARAATQSAYVLATSGSLALPETWRGEADWEVEGIDGRSYTNRFPLMAVYAAPFHLVADLASTAERPEHPHLISYAPSGIAAAIAAAAGVTVSFLLFRRLASRRLALAATAALAFGTGVWAVSADSLWPHSLTHLLLALGVLATADVRSAWSGLAFGASLLARPHLAVVPAVIGSWHALRKRSIQTLLLTGSLSALGLAAVVGYSRVLFGTWLPIAGYNTYAVDNVTGVSLAEYGERLFLALVDPVRGWLIYLPVLIVLLPFAVRGWRVSPWWVRAAAIAGVAYLLIQLRANVHHGGAQFFGPRLTIETTVLLAPLLLRTYQAHHQGRRWLAPAVHVLIAVGIVFHALGATVWRHPFVDLDASWNERIEELCTEEGYAAGCPEEFSLRVDPRPDARPPASP